MAGVCLFLRETRKALIGNDLPQAWGLSWMPKRLQGGEDVGAIRTRLDAREAMVFFEKIVTLFEVVPKGQKRRGILVRCRQGFEAVVGEPGGEDVNRQVGLALIVDQHGEPVDFLDPVVGNWNAANRSAVPMQKNVPAQVSTGTQYTVRSVWIVDVQAQVEIALRVEPIQIVEALGDLFVPEAPLRPQSSR